MACLDFDDPVVLGLGALVCDALLLQSTLASGIAVAVVVQLVVLLSLGVMAFVMFKVNQTERYCRKYAAVGDGLSARGAGGM